MVAGQVQAQPLAEPSGSAASERRAAFIGVVGALALVIGVAGAYLTFRSRRVRPPERRPPRQAPLVVPERRSRMICPTCRQDYEPGHRFCEQDGNRLVDLPDDGALRGPTGAVCPTCSHGYDPGVAVCPSDGDELVPWALAKAAPADARDGPEHKICPTCGSRYSGGSGFCCEDGTALVLIN